MDIFDDVSIKEEGLHNKFKLIRNNLLLTGEIEVLKDWTKGFEDRDGEIIKEFQTNFHSSFWEFYLFAVLKEAGLEVDFSKSRPDFIIEKPYRMYVEAVASNIKQGGEPEENRTLDDILTMLESPHLQEGFYKELDESIIRHSSAIHSKSNKYISDYSKLEYLDANTPYVMATKWLRSN